MQHNITRRHFLKQASILTLLATSLFSPVRGNTTDNKFSSREKYHKKPKLKNRDFSLVLSGGGALGIAHLGVLSDLEKHHLSPAEIVGTSMGSIIGACMSIGMKEKTIYEKVKSLSSLTNWVEFSLTGRGIIESAKLEKIFDSIFANRKMKDTNIPLKLIATDLNNGNKKVFSQKDDVFIKDAVLASMSIPGIFEQKVINNIPYGDGYLCENLGIDETSFHTVLAVDVMGENSFDGPLPDTFFKASNVMEMFERSVRILVYNQTNKILTCSKKNLYLLEPDTKNYKTFNFEKYKAIRASGENLL